MNDEYHQLIHSHKQIVGKVQQDKEKSEALQSELKDSVPLVEYERLRTTMDEVSITVDTMQKQLEGYQ